MNPTCLEEHHARLLENDGAGPNWSTVVVTCGLDHGHAGPHEAQVLPENGFAVRFRWEPKS